MASTRKSNKKTLRKSSDSTISTTTVDEGEKDPKRQRIILLNLPRAFAELSDNDDEDELPSTHFELTEVLCNVVSDRYSRDEKLRTLERLNKWAFTQDSGFLKSFHACSGASSVLNFIKKTMNDGNCVGANRMECIENSTQLILQVTYSGEKGVNKEIATKIADSLMDCDGINTLIHASKEYAGGDDIPQLKALNGIWNALRNITCKKDAMKDTINKDQAIALFDTGIDDISQLKSVDAYFVLFRILLF
jgi:hypothetical protein